MGLFAADVCGLPGVGGGGSLGRGGLCRPYVGVWAGGGGHVSQGPGLSALRGVCRPLAGEWEEMGRGCADGFACGVSVSVFACSGVHVWSRVGWEVWRRGLPSFAAAARILQMRARIWGTSWSVVGRGYFRGRLRPMRLSTL